ncbi:hypothetical protein [Streptomyces sp. NPDC056190]|uniref:hypothetical protein n=1 Tax=Streptomyces sp. NPDC056190 TaxID=3345741 RepID=UPI0035DAB82D
MVKSWGTIRPGPCQGGVYRVLTPDAEFVGVGRLRSGDRTECRVDPAEVLQVVGFKE